MMVVVSADLCEYLNALSVLMTVMSFQSLVSAYVVEVHR